MTHPRRSRRLLLLGVCLLATSRLSPTLAAADPEGEINPPDPAVAASAPSTAPGASNRDLLLSVTALMGVLVGMERLATWRVGVRHRRGAVLDVASALSPSRTTGWAVPEVSPVAWRAVRPHHRSGRFPRPTHG